MRDYKVYYSPLKERRHAGIDPRRRTPDLVFMEKCGHAVG